MNLHTPERQENETQSEYRARRAQSKAITKAATHPVVGSQSSRARHRDQRRMNGSLKGMYGAGLMAHFNRLREQSMERVGTQHDENGAYTLTGSACFITGERRKWLAGVSARRGY